ncbi:hypothetical protein F4808DRAFT_411470 [Astrocystis sublimbata]|nr:hypothetical protein F4808DRAFT_411470 [Astrocystis sublimbata]
MGRHEPLTSLALGRSPYDDVVEGEGEADGQEPTREYDEHGRVVNESSKTMNRDIIRAHNEVMLVIGVAEQEPGGPNNSAAAITRLHNEHENRIGRHFIRVGRLLIVAGIWGVHGVRQRILVYNKAARFPFLDLLVSEIKTHSRSQLLLAGMPSFFSAWTLQWLAKTSGIAKNRRWLRAIIDHVRFHLQIFVALQRLDLIPATRWLPGLDFFIPFSSASPFVAPPPPTSSNARSISEWVSKFALNLAPYVGYWLIGCGFDILGYFIRREIRRRIPVPWPSGGQNTRAVVPTSAPHRQSVPESPTLGEADREIRHTGAQSPDIDVDPLATNADGTGEGLPMGTVRRQGTFSSRGGDDYATDEEDSEMVNPTLISFDVDTSESTEPPAGVWSAELRPSNSGDPRTQQKEAPKYVCNTLTSFPSVMAADILTTALTHLLLTPFDVLTFRGMARSYSSKLGLPTDHMFKINLIDGLFTRMTLNLFMAEVSKFLISVEAWALVTVVAQQFHVTDEEWEEYQIEKERATEALAAEGTEAVGTA